MYRSLSKRNPKYEGEMIAYWRKESPGTWKHFHRYNIVNKDGNRIYPESVFFMAGFHERHIPIPEAILAVWDTEAKTYGSSYSETLKRDISWARKCNDRNDEVLLFNDSNDEKSK